MEEIITMKDLEEWSKECRQNRIKVSLTPKAKEDLAVQKIKKLTQELSAANAYIEELEEGNDKKSEELRTANNVLKKEVEMLAKEKCELQDKCEKYKAEYKAIADKYSQDVNNTISLDDRYQKQKAEIDKLTLEVEKLRLIRDQLIYALNKK